MAFEAVIELARASVIICFRVLNIYCHFRVRPQTGKKYCRHQKQWNPDVFLNLIHKFLGKWCNTKKKIKNNQLLSDKSSIIPSAKNQQVFNVESVEKSNDGMTDTYNEEEIETYTEIVRDNISYGHLGDWLCNDSRDGYAEADNIVGFIVDEICSPLPYATIRKTKIPRSVVKSVMLKADINIVENVLLNMAKVDDIKDYRRYFINSLYNEVLTYNFNNGCESRWASYAVARDFGYAV